MILGRKGEKCFVRKGDLDSQEGYFFSQVEGLGDSNRHSIAILRNWEMLLTHFLFTMERENTDLKGEKE